MKKKFIVLSIMFAIVGNFTACNNSTSKRAIEDGKIAIASSEYEKALNLFKLAIDEGGSKVEIQEYYDTLHKYLKAKEAYEKLEFDVALKEINQIGKISFSDNLQRDIKLLKENIEKQNKIAGSLGGEITKVKELIEKGEYDKAQEIINKINTEGLSEDLITIIDDLKTEITNGISKKEEENKKIEEQKKEDEKNQIIAKGISIIKENPYIKTYYDVIFYEIEKKDDNHPLLELRGKELYEFTEDSEYDSPSEFYYDPSTNKMYYINQGMWFIINDGFKNVTPIENVEYESAEDMKNQILGEKIPFTVEQAKEMLKSKEEELGFLYFDVIEVEYPIVIDNVKLYSAFARTDEGVPEFYIGSDGNLYTIGGVNIRGKLEPFSMEKGWYYGRD